MPRTDTILFDLFGTVVHFAARVPTIAVGGERRRSTLGWLEEPVARTLPGFEFATFLEAIAAVTSEIIATRPPDYIEVTSPERFQRALRRLGVDPARAAEIGIQLSEVHMQNLARMTELPDGHTALLENLRGRYRLGLVSNFDHQATAERILTMHGVAPYFESVTISAGFGRRKPHPSIFEHALRSLGAGPEHSLFVGDSFADDVVGAKGAGMSVVWLNPRAEAPPEPHPRADRIIGTLVELPAVLG